MSENRKRVIITVAVDFEGDYYTADEMPREVRRWINGGLEDRDDVTGWDYLSASVLPGEAVTE